MKYIGEKELTFKQRVFCREYVKNLGNGGQAAINAGYSKNCAYEIAYDLLRLPHIKKK